MIKGQNKISHQDWGESFGCKVCLFRIENTSGAYIELTNYGATLVSAFVPDKAGKLANVVLGYPSLAAYLADDCYLGATIGRFANRIAGAKFTLDGVTYNLNANDGNNTNHGGNAAFNTQVFDYDISENGISFSLLSKNGDSGFPGNIKLTVTYTWTDENELKISYHATTDKKTIANFTNHAYFNLSAKNEGIFDHSLHIYADDMLDVNDAYIPTGLINPAGKRALRGEVLSDKMIVSGDKIQGYNNCFVLQNNTRLKAAALLTHNATGRKLEVLTTYPSIMLYTGDYLACKPDGNYQRPYRAFDGLCLECQYYPDSPNHANFPSTVLEPGHVYNETIVYKFGVTD